MHKLTILQYEMQYYFGMWYNKKLRIHTNLFTCAGIRCICWGKSCKLRMDVCECSTGLMGYNTDII